VVISSRRGFIPCRGGGSGCRHSFPACSPGRRSGCLRRVEEITAVPPISEAMPGPRRARVSFAVGPFVCVAYCAPGFRSAGRAANGDRPPGRTPRAPLAPGIGHSAGSGAEGAALMMREANSAGGATGHSRWRDLQQVQTLDSLGLSQQRVRRSLPDVPRRLSLRYSPTRQLRLPSKSKRP
jgi:hypothetical protein